MNFKELGPFEGMTYRGRQLFDIIVKNSFTTRGKLLTDSTSREGENADDLFSVHVSDIGYSSHWRVHKTKMWVQQSLTFAGGAWIAFATVLAFGIANDFTQRGAYVPALIISALTSFFAVVAIGLAYEFVTSLRLGFFKDSGSNFFKRLSAMSWVVGNVALYISELNEKSGSIKVRTVFFDAIGSAYADSDKDGEALVLSARDGSEIARMPFPASATGASGNEIAAKIITRLRNHQPAAVAA